MSRIGRSFAFACSACQSLFPFPPVFARRACPVMEDPGLLSLIFTSLLSAGQSAADDEWGLSVPGPRHVDANHGGAALRPDQGRLLSLQQGV